MLVVAAHGTKYIEASFTIHYYLVSLLAAVYIDRRAKGIRVSPREEEIRRNLRDINWITGSSLCVNGEYRRDE